MDGHRVLDHTKPKRSNSESPNIGKGIHTSDKKSWDNTLQQLKNMRSAENHFTITIGVYPYHLYKSGLLLSFFFPRFTVWQKRYWPFFLCSQLFSWFGCQIYFVGQFAVLFPFIFLFFDLSGMANVMDNFIGISVHNNPNLLLEIEALRPGKEKNKTNWKMKNKQRKSSFQTKRKTNQIEWMK